MTPENAEAQLLGGQIDILDGTTLSGVAESRQQTADASQIELVVKPSTTWEHIDFNLSVR